MSLFVADPLPTKTPDNPFDHGNTEPQPLVTPKAPDPAPAAPAPDQRPRNADGTFKPAEAPAHPAYLREAAADLGFADDEIAAMAPEHLGAAVVRMQRILARERQTQTAARAVADGHVPNQQPEPDPDESFGIDPQTGEPRFDPVLSQEIVALRKKVRELEGTAKQTVEREQQRQLRTTTAMVDEAFEALGEADQAMFGKGSLADLHAQSPERARRLAIYQQAGINPETDTPRTIARKIKATRDLLFSAASPAKSENAYETPRSTPIDPQDWNKSALQKPTERQAEELPFGEERAVRNLAKKLQTQGSNGSTEKEGFPD